MSNPQQPELARSRKTPAQDQDAVASVVEGQRQPGTGGPTGPIPEDNQPGHHPAKEQDKPDLDAFAEKLGVAENTASADGGLPGERPVGPLPGSRRSTLIGAAGAGASVVALAVVAGRRRRRRSR